MRASVKAQDKKTFGTRENRVLNIKYAILQMMFWICAASAYAYLTQMLQYKGFAEDQIGVINAVKLFSTVVFQIIIGAFSDRYASRISLRHIIAVLTFAALVLTFVFYKYTLTFVQTIFLFVGFGATFTCISPLIDSLSIQYMNGGRNINYPMCRAAGSCAWAVACVLFGIFCDTYDANRLLILQMLFTGFMLAAVLVMSDTAAGAAHGIGGGDGDRVARTDSDKNRLSQPDPDSTDEATLGQKVHGGTDVAAIKNTAVHTTGYLLTRYPKYRWFLIGSAVMFMGYNVGTTFLINVFERLGGSNFHYGTAEFIMAISEVPSAFLLIKFRKRISLDKIMLCCAVFMTFKNMFAAFSDSVWVIIISQSCEMLGFGLFYSGSVYLVEEMLSPSDVVKGMSLINAFTMGAGEGIGALLCGFINSRYGLTAVMDSSVLISTVSIICIVIMCRKADRIHEKIS